MTERKPYNPAVRPLLGEQAAAAGGPPPPMTNEERMRMAHGGDSAGLRANTENATGCGLDGNWMRWFRTQYAPDASPTDPGTSPPRLPEVPARVATMPLHSPDMGHNLPATSLRRRLRAGGGGHRLTRGAGT